MAASEWSRQCRPGAASSPAGIRQLSRFAVPAHGLVREPEREPEREPTSTSGDSSAELFERLAGRERSSSRCKLAGEPACGGNLIILDEPTNDLDLPILRELEEALLEFPGVVICVTHDRFFLDRIATHILAFEGDEEG